MKMRSVYFLFCSLILLSCQQGLADTKPLVNRIDPPHWYHQMVSDTLQLLFYGDGIRDAKVKIMNNKATVLSYQRAVSENFLIVYLRINPMVKADIELEIECHNRRQKWQYPMLDIKTNPLSISPSDVMYLLMPDRFANGDVSNDQPAGIKEAPNRSKPKGRHGGDLKGINAHFDYLKELNISALWINPLIENNQPIESYHGYAATDLYKIDSRFGTNQDYQTLSQRCIDSNIRLVMDVVYNHLGSGHPFYAHMIRKEWFHLFDSFTASNYRGAAVVDPYAAQYDKMKMSNGWFDRHMPDLNQQDPDLAQYLIQNTLWWIAYARLSGIRIDTYPYPDLDFMENIVGKIKAQFPDVFVFGETWEHGSPLQTYFAQNKASTQHQSQLDAVTDFQLYFAIQKAFNQPFDWTKGLSELYYVLTFDYLYQNPEKLVTFADNHDVDRILGVLENNPALFKMAMGFLLTTRGIPCIYYGTEIGMNDRGDHGLLRKDMPGGWAKDSSDVFNADNRSLLQKDYFNFVAQLNRFRTSHSILFNAGMRIHFIPEKGVYAYFLETEDEMMAVFLCQGQKEIEVSLRRFSEVLKSGSSGVDVLDGSNFIVGETIQLAPESIKVLYFKK